MRGFDEGISNKPHTIIFSVEYTGTLSLQAVNERRVALETGDSVDASMSASSWSNYDD